MERKKFWPDRGLWVILLLIAGIGGCLYYTLTEVPDAHLQVGDKPLRLHILANSDSVEDQALKLALRDQVIGLVEENMGAAEDKQEAMTRLADSLPQLAEACNAYLAPRTDYGAHLELTVADFPEITYGGDLTLPAGEYDALRIVLGEGAGKNWWCVLFPPLCFVDLAGETEAVAATSANGQAENSLEVRFKFLDWLK